MLKWSRAVRRGSFKCKYMGLNRGEQPLGHSLLESDINIVPKKGLCRG